MALESWLAFALAYTVLALLPGPSTMMVVGQALSRGPRAAFACILGDLAGGVVIIACATLGLGIVLARSGSAFLMLKWAGVAYLALLGLRQIRAAGRVEALQPETSPSTRGSFAAGVATGLSNPKAIVFYMAFLAQFIDPTAPQLPQFLIIGATSSVIVATVLGGYALLAATVASRMRSLTARKRLGYASGSCLLGGSLLMAATR